MAHTYATLDEANDQLKSGGATTYATESAGIKALKLSILEAVSRRIDEVCHRSSFGSGFGPRIGTNRYDGDGGNELLLRDDLQSASAFTVAAATGATGVSPVVTTDYFLANPGGYNGPPWRKIILHQKGAPTIFGLGYRTIVVTGTWGFSDVTVTSTTTMASGFAASTTATTFTTSSSPTIVPGMTLLVGTEQMYLTALSGTTATVVRGVNGSTAAVHADSSAIAYYVYDARVNEVARRLFQRRWKARDAGADGGIDAMDVPGQAGREGERLIIERGLSGLMLLGTY